jgi:hypothetical protein
MVGIAMMLGLAPVGQSEIAAVANQQEEASPARPPLEWTPWISDVPAADMIGEWLFTRRR